MPAPATSLDPDVCRRARLSRDPRFDGEFFLGVRTTGIYCRPVCPARAPAEQNVSYFRTADQAAGAGYRPCLRCRPESAPGSPAWLGTSTTVQRALQLIRQGALNSGSLADLAERLGVGERYLRKLFQRELGVSPHAVALNQRLLFAKKLLAETAMPITDVAFAAGFGSVRRFNSAVRGHFRLTPGELRRRGSSPGDDSAIRLQLHYRPPYDWDGVLAFFRRHAIEGLEQVTDTHYRRRLSIGDGTARFSVSSLPDRTALQLDLEVPDYRLLMAIVSQVRRMFDLDAAPAMIAGQLGADPVIAPLLDRCPGIRAPGHGSLYEAAVRAIVGQQVSTAGARSICARLAAAAGETDNPAFPDARSLARLGDDHFPMPGRRRESLRALGRQFEGREDELDLAALSGLGGVGPWTLAMAGMRGSGDPDSFPAGDLGLQKAWQAIAPGGISLQQHADTHWRPWRAYAANLLWRSLSP